MALTDQPGAPNEACTHPQTRHRHGTHACYMLDPCRCDDCRDAHARYERRRVLWLAGVRPRPYIDAELARARVRALMAAGMGLHRINEVGGISYGVLWELMYGRNGQPSRRVRRETAQRILAIQLDLADGAKVPADEAWRIVDELLARGWTRAAIGRRVHGPQAVALQLGPHEVTVATLRALRQLLTEPVPPRRTRYGERPPRGRPPRPVEATTPGVPETETEPAGNLACRFCGRPLVDHALSEACWRRTA